MAVSNYFAFYNTMKTKIPFLNKISEEVISCAPEINKEMSLLNFVHPIIRKMQENDSRIKILEFNIFDTWKLGSLDAIKCANVLNLSYFNEQKLNIAFESLKSALKVNGLLAITRNLSSTGKEIGSIFQLKKNKKLELIKEINGGIDFKIEKRFFY